MQITKIERLSYFELLDVAHRTRVWNLDFTIDGKRIAIASIVGNPAAMDYDKSIIIYGFIGAERIDLLKKRYPLAKIQVEMKNKESE